MPHLHRSAWLLCGDPYRAEDLTQETLAKVYAKWGPRLQNPAAYAHTTLVRTYISAQRRRSSHEQPWADVPATADSGDDADLRLVLRAALATLEPLDRAVVVLRYLDDLSVDEVGRLLGLPRPRSARASVFRDNGFRVWVMINNAAGKGSASGGPPPLGVPDLEQVATSDLWFR